LPGDPTLPCASFSADNSRVRERVVTASVMRAFPRVVALRSPEICRNRQGPSQFKPEARAAAQVQ